MKLLQITKEIEKSLIRIEMVTQAIMYLLMFIGLYYDMLFINVLWMILVGYLTLNLWQGTITKIIAINKIKKDKLDRKWNLYIYSQRQLSLSKGALVSALLGAILVTVLVLTEQYIIFVIVSNSLSIYFVTDAFFMLRSHGLPTAEFLMEEEERA